MEYRGYDVPEHDGQLKVEQCINLVDALEDRRPERIIEFSQSGSTSTSIFNQYCKKYDKPLLIIETKTSYSSEKENVIAFPVVENTDVVVANKTYGKCNKYDGFEAWLTEQQDKFDFIFIDDPVEYGLNRINHYTYCRVQVLDFPLLDKLANHAVIYYHDSNLKYAKNTLAELDSILAEKNFAFERSQDIRDSLLVNTLGQMTKYIITKNS